MADQVLADGLGAEETMRVYERAVILASGVTVWLRRFTLDADGRRYLADGRWVALRGGDIQHMYASPRDATHGSGAEWAYRSPHSFGTWQEALEAARLAEQADEMAQTRKRRNAS